jgi:hypothetical protein
MKLLSWNLNGRRAEARRQVDAVVRQRPDIVAFQEVTGETIGILRRALIERALPFALNSFELQESPSRLTGPRLYGLLIAGRMPFEPVLQDFRVPWPERVLAAQIRLAAGAFASMWRTFR